MHFIGADQTHGFEERLTPDIYPADFSWSADWEDDDYTDCNDDRALTIAGPCANTVQIDYDQEVAHKAVRKLYAIAAAKDDPRPFFMQVSFTHPHEPYLCLKEHWDLYRDARIFRRPRCRICPTRPTIPCRCACSTMTGMHGKTYPPELALRARRGYYGSISFIDDRVGELLRVLDETGQAENTVILFTSDHGDMFGERGMWFKRTFYEPSLRVPFLIHAPGRFAPARVATQVSLVDLLPTVMSIATGGDWEAPADALDGTDATAFIGQPEEERSIVAEYFSESAEGVMMMIRRGRHKYIYSAADPERLYDIGRGSPGADRPGRRGPAREALLSSFREEKAALWDEDWLTRDILRSQRRRRFVHAAMRSGTPVRHDGQVGLWRRCPLVSRRDQLQRLGLRALTGEGLAACRAMAGEPVIADLWPELNYRAAENASLAHPGRDYHRINFNRCVDRVGAKRIGLSASCRNQFVTRGMSYATREEFPNRPREKSRRFESLLTRRKFLLRSSTKTSSWELGTSGISARRHARRTRST